MPEQSKCGNMVVASADAQLRNRPGIAGGAQQRAAEELADLVAARLDGVCYGGFRRAHLSLGVRNKGFELLLMVACPPYE
jgi:hypothetical protein